MLDRQQWRVIGLMSGTSLDGLDVVDVQFNFIENQWVYKIILAKTLSYDSLWINTLKKAHELSGEELIKLDRDYGKYISHLVMSQFTLKDVDFVASHGHTIFHNPLLGFTLQIGHGGVMSEIMEKPVVSDFRSQDIANSGQGAPLVPVAEKYLFSKYQTFLNLGGIANISFHQHDTVKAFDIVPCNMWFNKLAEMKGLLFDKDGAIAKKGEIISELFLKLSNDPYFKKHPPKSLGREWFDNIVNWNEIVDSYGIENSMRTCLEVTATEIAKTINSSEIETKVFITGGGSLNSFLIENLKGKVYNKHHLEIPDDNSIHFKEAISFAFLGLLRINNLKNTLQSVTGATKNTVSGALYGRL